MVPGSVVICYAMCMNATNPRGRPRRRDSGDEVVALRDVIGGRVQRARKDLGWTQQRLADRLGEITGQPVSRVVVANLEGAGRRQQSVSVDMLFALAMAFGVAPVDLLVAEHGDTVVQIGSQKRLSDTWRDYFRDGPPGPASLPSRENPGELLAVLAEQLRGAAPWERPKIALDVMGVAQGMLRAALMHQDRINARKDENGDDQ